MTDDIAFLAEPPTRIRYRIIVWLSVAAVLAYFCRNSVGVAESTIRKGLDFSESESGWFLGAFFWTYALFQVPAGALESGMERESCSVAARSSGRWASR